MYHLHVIRSHLSESALKEQCHRIARGALYPTNSSENLKVPSNAPQGGLWGRSPTRLGGGSDIGPSKQETADPSPWRYVGRTPGDRGQTHSSGCLGAHTASDILTTACWRSRVSQSVPGAPRPPKEGSEALPSCCLRGT